MSNLLSITNKATETRFQWAAAVEASVQLSFCQLFATVEGAKPRAMHLKTLYQLDTPLCDGGSDKTHIRGATDRGAELTEGRFHSIFMDGRWL